MILQVVVQRSEGGLGQELLILAGLKIEPFLEELALICGKQLPAQFLYAPRVLIEVHEHQLLPLAELPLALDVAEVQAHHLQRHVEREEEDEEQEAHDEDKGHADCEEPLHLLVGRCGRRDEDRVAAQPHEEEVIVDEEQDALQRVEVPLAVGRERGLHEQERHHDAHAGHRLLPR